MLGQLCVGLEQESKEALATWVLVQIYILSYLITTSHVVIFIYYILLKHVCLLPCLYLYVFVLLYFFCFVLKYQSVKELLRAHVCHVDFYIYLPTLNTIYFTLLLL